MAHVANKRIQTPVAPASQPVNNHMPVDQLGMNIQPNVAVYYKPGDTTDDSKFTAGDLTAMLARGDIH